MVCVSGKIITKSFEGKDGTRKYITEIEAEDLQLLASSRKQAIG